MLSPFTRHVWNHYILKGTLFLWKVGVVGTFFYFPQTSLSCNRVQFVFRYLFTNCIDKMKICFWPVSTFICHILQMSVEVLVSWIIWMPNIYKVEGKPIQNILGILSKVFHKWISFRYNFMRNERSVEKSGCWALKLIRWMFSVELFFHWAGCLRALLSCRVFWIGIVRGQLVYTCKM